ncbi:LysR family transcriptional regulator [Halodesulfovibrio marinisediminis]|uniref:DNA-binding transcriptional regulator, LysR family n=1 Tax=Halodesulfovibrio marinisediminis DSM 17456 TaxID=1121457 RepID=A0A1N6GV49_9BACT|nr:LysR family transcriptional regulator [Halodesulfovibrio marinisediminis]SIO11386.1 DNA-binding transcriptional regulator, LysR family [Halodesulfovibrio marinisediminis DSM 17456]
MLFSLEQLEAFVAAVEFGSFSAAARHLGKAQSRISTAVANLEIDLGVTLFDRSGKFPVLTSDGERILNTARGVLYQCRVVVDTAEQIIEKPQVLLRMAVEELISCEAIGSVLADFAKEFGYIQVEVLWAAIGDVKDLILKERVDIGVAMPATGIPDDECSWKQLGSETFWPMVGSNHPLAKLSSVTADDLWGHMQLVASSKEGVREPDSGILSEKMWMCEDSKLMIDLVRRGVGWAWLAESQTQKLREREELVSLPLTFLQKGYSGSFNLLWKKDYPLRPAEKWLADRLQQVFS